MIYLQNLLKQDKVSKFYLTVICFRETMGADGAFDRRRLELAEISGKSSADVTDDEVRQQGQRI